MAGAKLRISKFSDPWKSYTINEIFDRVGNPVELEEGTEYQEIGIRSHGKGLFYKDKTTAEEIGNKRVFWIEPDCFIVNIVFAWERAVARTTQAEVGMIASHRFPMYKPKENLVDLDYITQFFTTKRGQNLLILASPGGAGRNKTLGQKEFGETRVKLPSVQEQREVADILKEVDQVINLAYQDLNLWEERKKGVVQNIFSQKVRFKNEKGEKYPEWEQKKLKDFANRITRKNKNEETELPLTISAEYGLINQLDFFSKKVAATDLSGYYLLKKGEFAYNKSTSKDSPVGAIKRLDLYEMGAVSTLYICFALDDSVLSDYVVKYFDSTVWHSEIQAICAEGARNHGLLNVPVDGFFDMSIQLPCLEEQKKIADCISAIDDVIAVKKKKLEIWEKIKKGLLQQMFV